MKLINENSDYQIEVSGDGFHPVNLPAADRYQIQSVSNQFGCAEGFGNTDVSIDIRSPAIGYLPLLPDLCKEDAPYVLPEMPGGIPGVWTMEGEYLTSVNPATLDVGWTTLDFEPTDECAETQSTDIEILPVPVTDFDLPTIPCADKYYQPVMDPATSSGGTWTIDPAVAIDPATGGVYLADLVQGQTYTWIYTISGQCTSSSSGFIEVPECPCEIEIVHETQCGDNGSPADPSDDIFEIDLIVSGSNTSSEWVSDDRNWSGQYGNWYDLGPFPINNGPVHLSIHDSEDLTCLTSVSIHSPETCSHQCEIVAKINSVNCDDNGSPTDPVDDVFTYEMTVSGTNISTTWTAADGQMSGAYNTSYSFGPFPISEGERAITVGDDDDPDCQSTLTINPPLTCSEECELTTIVSNVSCDDNGSSMDTTDDL